MKFNVLLILNLFYLSAWAKDIPFSFERISPPSGLTLEAVSSIVQDHSGYIWLGTNRGLFKFDSEKFEIYTHQSDDTTSIPHNVITDILVDTENNLWIATRIGLSVYNQKSRQFSRFPYTNKAGQNMHGNIIQLAMDKTGNIWLLDEEGLGILNKVSHQVFRVDLKRKELPNVIHLDYEGNIWVSTINGSVFKIDPISFQTAKIIEGNSNKNNTIYIDSSFVYIADAVNGLLTYSHNGESITTPFKESSLLSGKDIRVITQDHSGQLWFGAYDGIYIKTDDQLIKVVNKQQQASTYAIYADQYDGMWIGTWAGGVYHYHPQYHRFKSFAHSEDPHSLSNDIVSSFAISPQGNLIIGTEAGGLNSFHSQSGLFDHIKLFDNDQTLNVKDQCFDQFGGHWVATNRYGLWYKKDQHSQYVQFPEGEPDGRHLLNKDVYSLTPVDSGIWIGTHGGGLHFYHFIEKRILYPDSLFNGNLRIPNNFIRVLYIDTHNFLWVGTVNSLIRVNLHDGSIINHTNVVNSPLRNDYIYSISQPFSNEIWIGTRTDGINIYNYQTDKTTYFDANGFLYQKDVYGIIKDDQNNLWITSNDGLIMHDLITNTTHRFSKEDGIQGNWFYPNAILKDDSGMLYFGGNQGFSMIHPSQIKLNDRRPNVTINKLTVNNDQVIYPEISSKDTIIQVLKLKHFQRTLRFEYASDNYLLSEKNKYQYRLINHYDEWLDNPGEASVLFTNLAWGDYIFEVRSCNNDGLWSQNAARIQIIIPKPFYAQNATLFGYICIIGLIAWYIFRIIKRRIRLENQVREEKNRTRQIEELNEMKLKFYTNISHEFRTPLSLIIGPLSTLLKDNTLVASHKEMIEVIHRNSTRLLTLINQLMDLRKLEGGKETLNTSQIPINTFIQNCTLNFNKEAESRGIDFKFHPLLQDNIIEADSDKLDLIITNLLSNAFKFTPENGSIDLAIKTEPVLSLKDQFQNAIYFGNIPEKEFVSLVISDSGIGIEKEELKHIFNRFEHSKKHRKGSSGIGLALCLEYTLMHHGHIAVYSTPQKGSVFHITLPLIQTDFQSDQPPAIYQNNTPLNVPEPAIENHQSFEPQFDKVILVVEDNSDLRNYIENILERNFTIRTAPDGRKAIEILENSHIDLVVSDIMMPDVDGLELCRNIKSNMATSHIPVILLTALSSVEQKIEGINVGADAYVPKPFNDVLLTAQINNLLIQRKKLSEYFALNLDNNTSSSSGLDNYFLSRLNKVIEENLTNEDLDVEVFTKEIGISRSQLHRKLKSLTNYSTTEYIRTYKLEKALELMKTGQYNINEISYLVGFSSHTYFSRCFKKHFKKSPKELLQDLQDAKK